MHEPWYWIVTVESLQKVNAYKFAQELAATEGRPLITYGRRWMIFESMLMPTVKVWQTMGVPILAVSKQLHEIREMTLHTERK